MLEAEAIAQIERAIKRGNTVEVKFVHGKVEIIEIQRKLILKATLTTG